MKTKLFIFLLFQLLISLNIQAANNNGNELPSKANQQQFMQQFLATWNASCDATGSSEDDPARLQVERELMHLQKQQADLIATEHAKQAKDFHGKESNQQSPSKATAPAKK
jgi:hypothetical protein